MGKLRVAVIGAGIYGTYIAETLAKLKEGEDTLYEITLYERSERCLGGLSGEVGVRVIGDPGPTIHYAESPVTREQCQKEAKRFNSEFGDLTQTVDSTYGIAIFDLHGKRSKVTPVQTKAILDQEYQSEYQELDRKDYPSLQYIVSVKENVIVIGDKRKEFFENRLKQHKNIECRYNSVIQNITKEAKNFSVKVTNKDGKDSIECFDFVINATGDPNQFAENDKGIQQLFGTSLGYQARIGVVCQYSGPNPKSCRTVMSGAVPCMMPYITDESGESKTLVLLTHTASCTLGIHPFASTAREILDEAKESKYAQLHAFHQCVTEISKYFPETKAEHFTFDHCVMGVLPTLATSQACRCGTVIQDPQGVIHTITGKIPDIFTCAEQAITLMSNNVKDISETEGYRYITEGPVDKMRQEIQLYNERQSPSMHQIGADKKHRKRSRSKQQDCVAAILASPQQAFNALIGQGFMSPPRKDPERLLPDPKLPIEPSGSSSVKCEG